MHKKEIAMNGKMVLELDLSLERYIYSSQVNGFSFNWMSRSSAVEDKWELLHDSRN